MRSALAKKKNNNDKIIHAAKNRKQCQNKCRNEECPKNDNEEKPPLCSLRHTASVTGIETSVSSQRSATFICSTF